MGTGQMSVTESKGIPPRRTSDLSPNKQSDLSPTDVWTAGWSPSLARRPVDQLLDRAVCRLVAKTKVRSMGRCLIGGSINSSFPAQASGAS
jgi:hypothetical protein